MTRDVGDAVDTSTPARALKAQARRQIPSWHWLKVFLEGQRIALESITEAASSGKKQIARDADLRQLTEFLALSLILSGVYATFF